MRFLLFFSAVLIGIIQSGPRNQDCTSTFKNRVASFEYTYYPGYWLYPYHGPHGPLQGWVFPVNYASIGSSSVESVKTDKTYQWILHPCGDRLCIESKRAGWGNYFMGPTITVPHTSIFVSMYHDSDLEYGDNERISFSIWCDSCSPSIRDKMTYSNCQLNNNQNEKVYVSSKSRKLECLSCGSDSWFQWRILSPPTTLGWQTVFDHCNTGSTATTVHHSLKGSITTSTSETHTVSVSDKISAGRAAVKLITATVLPELGLSSTFSRTKMTEYANEEVHTLTKELPPGWKWIVERMVGQADYTTITTNKYKESTIQC